MAAFLVFPQNDQETVETNALMASKTQINRPANAGPSSPWTQDPVFWKKKNVNAEMQKKRNPRCLELLQVLMITPY